MFESLKRLAPAYDRDLPKVAELEASLKTLRALLSISEEQLQTAQQMLQVEQSRHEAVSKKLQRAQASRCTNDEHGWGLEPGVGI